MSLSSLTLRAAREERERRFSSRIEVNVDWEMVDDDDNVDNRDFAVDINSDVGVELVEGEDFAVFTPFFAIDDKRVCI